MYAPPWDPPSSLPAVPVIDLPERVDVCVIGCGLAGSVVALELSRAGAEVAILERGEATGQGASGRRPGLACAGHPEHPGRLVQAIGLDDASELHRHGLEGLDYLVAENLMERTGAVWASLGHQEIDEMSASVQAIREMGSAATPLDADEVNRRLQAQGFGHGMWIPEDGLFDPATATPTLATRAVRAGASLTTHCTVRGISQRPEGIAVHTDGGRTLTCDVVVFASESQSPTIDSFFAEKVVPVREQALAVRAPIGRVPVPGRAQYGYLRWQQRGEVLTLGGCRWATPHMEVGETDATGIAPRVQERLDAALAQRFPDLARAEVLSRWSWIEATTCDRLPIVGPLPGAPTVVCCVGFQGHAPSLGIAAATGVARGLITGDHRVPARLSPARFL